MIALQSFPQPIKDKVTECFRLLSQALVCEAKAYRKMFPDEHFYVGALVTDSCFSCIHFALNSEEFFEEAKAGWEPDSFNEPRWMSGEWGAYIDSCLPKEDQAYMSQAYEIMCALDEELDRSLDSTIKESPYFSIMEAVTIQALNDVQNEIRTILQNEELLLFVTMTDDSYTEELENKSFVALNPTKFHQEFIDRYMTEERYRAEAEIAWQSKDYAAYVERMSHIAQPTSLEEKKIEIAKKKTI